MLYAHYCTDASTATFATNSACGLPTGNLMLTPGYP